MLGSKEALLFVNKKKQKNFFNTGMVPFTTARPKGTVQMGKSFLVLFFKKEHLALLRPY
jgi:hypothetical protein